MKILIPKGSILVDTITVDGYKFFYKPGDVPQCATCCNIMGIMPKKEKFMGKIREVELIKDCDCPRQEE